MANTAMVQACNGEAVYLCQTSVTCHYWTAKSGQWQPLPDLEFARKIAFGLVIFRDQLWAGGGKRADSKPSPKLKEIKYCI